MPPFLIENISNHLRMTMICIKQKRTCYVLASLGWKPFPMFLSLHLGPIHIWWNKMGSMIGVIFNTLPSWKMLRFADWLNMTKRYVDVSFWQSTRRSSPNASKEASALGDSAGAGFHCLPGVTTLKVIRCSWHCGTIDQLKMLCTRCWTFENRLYCGRWFQHHKWSKFSIVFIHISTSLHHFVGWFALH